MKIYEYRIIIPATLEKYQIANIYMTAKRSQEESKQVQGEGIETIKDEPFSNEKESGVYTYKIMHFKSRIPRFMRWALPDKYCHCHEESYNAFPHYNTIYNQPGLGENFIMSVESYHVPYKHGEPIPDNLLNLTPKELEMRKIMYLDVLGNKPKPSKERDLSKWQCPILGVTKPFAEYNPKKKKKDDSLTEPPDWTTTFDGEMMVAVKVVKFMFKWKGLQTVVEKFGTQKFYPNLFTDAHRDILRWSDQWASMDMQQVREYEKRVYEETNALGFEKDDDKPDEEIPDEKPKGVPDEENDESTSH